MTNATLLKENKTISHDFCLPNLDNLILIMRVLNTHCYSRKMGSSLSYRSKWTLFSVIFRKFSYFGRRGVFQQGTCNAPSMREKLDWVQLDMKKTLTATAPDFYLRFVVQTDDSCCYTTSTTKAYVVFLSRWQSLRAFNLRAFNIFMSSLRIDRSETNHG